jgi:hypothetical protein
MASEKHEGSLPEASSNVEKGKMNWADMVEEEERENEQKMKESIKTKGKEYIENVTNFFDKSNRK